jgi:hypothetical protein
MRALLLKLVLACAAAYCQPARLLLPPATVSVKVERDWAVAQTGARRLSVFDLRSASPFSRSIDINAADFHVISVVVLDFSVAPEDALYVSAYVNFGLGERVFSLLRYDLTGKAPPHLYHLPNLNCPHLAAGAEGVWCLDPYPRLTGLRPPTLHWIGWLGAVKSYPLGLEGDATLGAPRVIAGPEGDRAHLWWTVRRVVLDVDPVAGIVETSPIAVFGRGRAITSFAAGRDGAIQALLPLRGDGEEGLTTAYALAQLDAARKSWRRLLPRAQFVRGAQLAGWGGGRLWLWDRRGHALEAILEEK